MDDLDREISEALKAEDRETLNQFGELGLFAQWFGMYRGPQGWIASVTTVVMAIMAGAGFYSLWKLIGVGATGPDAIKWGALALLMLTMVSFIKVWFWMRMEANRVIREVKRLELQIARAIDR